jgi:hypothetical protein
LILTIIFLFSSPLFAIREHLKNGISTHTIEFDFGNNWAEAIGQSSYYSIQTKKKAGIVLIMETMMDRKYWIRLNTTIEHFKLPIDTWSIGDAAY